MPTLASDLAAEKLDGIQVIFTLSVLCIWLTLNQGEKNIYFCGAYTRYGFHEDGAISGFKAAHKVNPTTYKWIIIHSHLLI